MGGPDGTLINGAAGTSVGRPIHHLPPFAVTTEIATLWMTCTPPPSLALAYFVCLRLLQTARRGLRLRAAPLFLQVKT
jgi:hypothetical protein